MAMLHFGMQYIKKIALAADWNICPEQYDLGITGILAKFMLVTYHILLTTFGHNQYSSSRLVNSC